VGPRARRLSAGKVATTPLTTAYKTTGQKNMGDYAEMVIRPMRCLDSVVSVVW